MPRKHKPDDIIGHLASLGWVLPAICLLRVIMTPTVPEGHVFQNLSLVARSGEGQDC